MKKIIIIFSMFVSLSCTNKNNAKEQIIQEENTEIDTVSNVDEADISHILNEEYKYRGNESTFGIDYGCIIYITDIINDVNVYVLPNLNSRVKDKLSKSRRIIIIGISDNDNYWVKIYYGEEEGSFPDPKTGWILSSYVNIEKINISNLVIEKKEINKSGYIRLYGTYNSGSLAKEFSVLVNKLENQDFYSFSWDHTEKGFHYSNKPGLYIWYEEQNELRHISYAGGEGSKWGFSSWAIVTDDFKYMFQDQGTNIPPRGVVIWNLENGEEILSEMYYMNINLKGHSIEVVKFYKEYYNNKWSENGRSGLTDEEIIFAQKFINENDPNKYFKEELPNSFGMLIVYEYNIDTTEKRIIGGKYCHTH
jgi:hypothetical protein